MAPIVNRETSIRLQDARTLVDLVWSTATKSKSEPAKKILLRAACDIADLAIEQQKLLKAA